MSNDSLTPAEAYWQFPSQKERTEALGTPLSVRVRIHYASASGELTVRTVRVTHFQKVGADRHFVGHCELRNEKRAFRTSRAKHAYDIESGERIDSLSGWFQNKSSTVVYAGTAVVATTSVAETPECPFCVFAKYGDVHTPDGRCLHCGVVRRLAKRSEG